MRWLRRVMVFCSLVLLAIAEPERPVAAVLLDAGRHHLGDNEAKDFSPGKPLGPEWSTAVPDLPALPENCFWGFVAEVRHVVDANHRGYEKGGFFDEILVEGKPVARLNDFVGGEADAVHEVWVPLEGVTWKKDAKISVKAGKDTESENLDDFEIGNIRLAPMRRVRVNTGGPAKIAVAGAPRLGPEYTAKAAGRVAFTPDGAADLLLPADRPFRLTASRGPEFHVAVAETPAWSTGPVSLEPKRAFDTPGMVAADFHLHADPSGDSRVPLRDRITSYLAEGLEYVVATDHNHATDYRPAIRDLKADHLLRSSIGDEITTHRPNIGHFNVFPIDKAIDASALTPKTLLDRLPKDGRILQVNHPRDGGIGYFNLFKFAASSASSPHPDFHTHFEAIEIFNGHSDWAQLERCLGDWYSLLNAGIVITATGNSDSHRLVVQDAGWPRNYVITGKEGLLTEQEVVAAVKAHRVVVSAGPVLEIVDGNGNSVVGETLKGDKATVRVRLKTPPWAPVNRVRVIRNGEEWVLLEPVAEQEIELSSEQGGWFVFVAEGEKYEADVVTHGRVRPWGFTNPVWLKP